MMPICKRSEFMLCQVCPQDHKQTTFKMLVFWMEFGSFRALQTHRLHLQSDAAIFWFLCMAGCPHLQQKVNRVEQTVRGTGDQLPLSRPALQSWFRWAVGPTLSPSAPYCQTRPLVWFPPESESVQVVEKHLIISELFVFSNVMFGRTAPELLATGNLIWF